MKFPGWERDIWQNFRLYKGNIFPSRKSVVSDIPAGEGKTAKSFLRCTVSSTNHSLYSVECILRRLNYTQGDTIGYIAPTCPTNEQYLCPYSTVCALLYSPVQGCASVFCSNRDKNTRLCEKIWRESFVLPLPSQRLNSWT